MGGITNKTVHLSFAVDWSKEVNPLLDAETVMAQLSGWFEDYNENAPHKALRMLSPREFIRSLQNLECPV